MAPSELVAILLVSIAGIVILVLFTDIRANIDGTQEQACSAQVRAAAATNKIFGRDYNTSMPACQTKYVTVAANKDDVVKRELAEEMRKCAYQWGRGEIELFNGPGYYCAVCSAVRFDNITKELYEENSGAIRGFHTYLRETNVPGGAQTYAQYLGSVTNDEGLQTETPLNAFVVDTEKDYVVLFTYQKIKTDGDTLQLLADMGGKDLTPAEQAKLMGTATVVAGTIAKTTAVAAGSGAFITAAVAAGPVGWAVLGVSGLIVGGVALYSSAKLAVPVATMTYFSARYSEEWYTISATYITPNDPENEYVKACEQAAEPTRSP